MKNNDSILEQKVKSIEVKAGKSVSRLLSEMENTGFQGRKLAESVSVLEKMIKDPAVTILFGFSASLAVAGQWKIVKWLIENNYIDVLVSTGANISEDLVEAMGYSYFKGADKVDDTSLFEKGFNRYYDIYGKERDYIEMTEMISDFILSLTENYNYSSREFLFQFGLWLEDKGIESLISTAAKHNVPVFCPGIADSPYGDAALIAKSKGFTLSVDAMKDYVEFMSLAEHVEQTGVIYIGGGVPKDFIQLFAATSNLLYENRIIPNKQNMKSRHGTDETYYPHKYAVQITTDSPQWGGLSGCTFEEAISWGKETAEGNFVQCYCDATIGLPLVSHALAERIAIQRAKKELSLIYSDIEQLKNNGNY